MNSVTIGKYIPGNSFVHKLDPRVKLLVNILLIVLVFLTSSLIMQTIFLAPIMLAFLFSHLRKTLLISSLKPVVAIGLFIFVINLFILGKTGQVGETYGSWWKFTLSDRAIQLSLLIMIRIYIMILTTTLLTATTSPMALTRAIEDVLFPLRLLRIKVHIIALIIAIALRFIPTLLEEAQRIMKAQASRGVDFKNGNLKTKAKSLVTLIIPLFVSAFTKADDLAYAMETRGYDPYEKRSRYRVYVPGWTDYLVVLFYAGMIALVVLFLNGQVPIPTWIS